VLDRIQSSKAIYTASDLRGATQTCDSGDGWEGEASVAYDLMINLTPSVADMMEDQDPRLSSCTLDSDVRW